MKNINLKEETIDFLRLHNKEIKDIKYIGGNDFFIDIDKFFELADTYYDNDFGAQKVAEDLVIVGCDWWARRVEYDGLEEWEFLSIPQKPKEMRNIECLTIDQTLKILKKDYIGWKTLKKLNEKTY